MAAAILLRALDGRAQLLRRSVPAHPQFEHQATIRTLDQLRIGPGRVRRGNDAAEALHVSALDGRAQRLLFAVRWVAAAQRRTALMAASPLREAWRTSRALLGALLASKMEASASVPFTNVATSVPTSTHTIYSFI